MVRRLSRVRATAGREELEITGWAVQVALPQRQAQGILELRTRWAGEPERERKDQAVQQLAARALPQGAEVAAVVRMEARVLAEEVAKGSVYFTGHLQGL